MPEKNTTGNTNVYSAQSLFDDILAAGRAAGFLAPAETAAEQPKLLQPDGSLVFTFFDMTCEDRHYQNIPGEERFVSFLTNCFYGGAGITVMLAEDPNALNENTPARVIVERTGISAMDRNLSDYAMRGKNLSDLKLHLRRQAAALVNYTIVLESDDDFDDQLISCAQVMYSYGIAVTREFVAAKAAGTAEKPSYLWCEVADTVICPRRYSMKCGVGRCPQAAECPLDLCSRGCDLYLEGDKDEFVLLLAKATDMAPNYTYALNELADACLTAGSMEECYAMAERSYFVKPDARNTDVLYRCAKKLGRTAEAAKYLEQLKTLDPARYVFYTH